MAGTRTSASVFDDLADDWTRRRRLRAETSLPSAVAADPSVT